MAKKWHRLWTLLSEAGLTPESQSHEHMFAAVRSRFPHPKIQEHPPGRLRVEGFPVNRQAFERRVCLSLESRGDITSAGWEKACSQVAWAMAKKAAKQTRNRIEKTTQMGWESVLVMGHVSADVFYASREWRRVRLKALEIHGSRCLCCGASPETGSVLHVDHVRPRSRYPDLSLDIDNLQVLCEACNIGKGAEGEQDWRQP
jgi:5-methylcytosine-specific restriction endonuclease McrA